ncbi:hypothetical protein V7659_30455 [Neobacillus drentensis]
MMNQMKWQMVQLKLWLVAYRIEKLCTKIFTYWNDFDNGKEKKPLND